MYKLKSFVNTPVDSVTYILSNQDNLEAIVIDPGTQDDHRLSDYLTINKLKLKHIFITHEHFDHILGANYLRRKYPDAKLMASEKTSERLSNPKRNLAIFHNQINLIVDKADIVINTNQLTMIGMVFEVYETPGHTDSSISLQYEDLFFSGDFLLQGTRVVTNLPSGSKMQYQESLSKYHNLLIGKTIYPGHGKSYIYK